MKKNKVRKVIIGLAGGLLAIALLVVVALLLLPHVINIQQVKAKILARVSREIKGQVDFEKVDVRFFPGIRVTVRGGRIEVPGKASLSLESLGVGVKILPLIKGKVEPSRVVVAGLRGWVVIQGGGKGPSRGPAVKEESLRRALAFLSSKAPGLEADFQGGGLTFYWDKRRKALPLSHFQGSVTLPPDKLKVRLSLVTPHVKGLVLRGWLGAGDLEGELHLSVKGLDLAHILSLFSLHSNSVPREALVNLSLNGDFRGLKQFRGTVEGSIPCLAFKKGAGIKPFMCSSLKAHFSREDNSWVVGLDSLVMEYPRVTLKGEFVLDPGKKRAFLKVTGTDIDVPSVRKVLLSLAGDHKTVKEIFGIVRGGRVPSIIFNFQGTRLGDLKHLDNMVMKGSLERGTIRIPKVHLMVEDVGGKVLIQKGILYGRDLVGRLKNSRILSGTLKVDLRHKNPFRVKAHLDADLSQLPGVLNQVLKGGLLLREINKMSKARGEALGTLVVEHDGHKTWVEVDAQKVTLSCNYSRVPYPIKILDGAFSYKGTRIQVKNMRGYLGKSAFSGLSARVEWGGSRGVVLKVPSMRGSILLDEIYPWITSYSSVKGALKDFSSMKGTLQVTSLTFQGPVSHPSAWRFRLEGGLKDFSMDFSLFPDTLRVKKGRLTMTPGAIAFQGCSTRLLDATPVVTGNVKGYLQGVESLELNLDGEMGPRAARWVYDFIHLAREYRVKAPLTLNGVHVFWERKGRTDFSGKVMVGRVTANIDLEMLGDLLLIRDLKLVGMGSTAHIGLTFQGRSLSVNFKGRIDKALLDAFLEKNTILKGEARGDFALNLDLGKMVRFSAKGYLRLRGFSYFWGLKMPIKIDEAIIKARGAGVDVEKAVLALKTSSVEVHGRISLADGKLYPNLEVSAPSLDVKEIESLLSKEGEGPVKNWDLPLAGEVKAQVFSVFYRGYVWSPVQALVRLFPNKVEVDVQKALLCGVSTPGVLTFTPGNMALDVKVEADNRDLGDTLYCLFGSGHLAEGHFSVKGYLKAWGREDPLAENSTGKFSFRTGKGRIYKFNLLSKVFSVVGVTEVLRGRLPILNINKEGFGYRSIKAESRFKNGVLLLDECVIDGNAVKVFASGKVNFIKDDMDITVLVAPFKVLDSVVSKIPILGRILTGKSKTLLSVPVKVTGKLDDPKVTPLSPTSVGEGILGVVKRTIEAPVKLIAPSLGKEGSPSGQ